MKLVHDILEIVVLIISTSGAVVVAWGVIEAMTSFVLTKFRPGERDAESVSDEIRQRLGAHLLLGLEVFIAADIISTVVSPTWEKVGILSVIVIIRTVLSYFLWIELRREDHEHH